MNTEEKRIRISRSIGIIVAAILVAALIYLNTSSRFNAVEVEAGVEVEATH